jgi:hypothetical protein
MKGKVQNDTIRTEAICNEESYTHYERDLWPELTNFINNTGIVGKLLI